MGAFARQLMGFVRRFRSERGGATALEFAMVALPFFFMMFAILELGRVFVLASTLENAAMDAGRLIRTGQIQTTGGTAATFKTAICQRMGIFGGDCQSRLSIDVRVLPQFNNPSAPDPMAGGTFSEGQLTFQPGDAEDIILVRSWWRQPLFTPFMAAGLSRLNDGNVVLSSATAFRNEPYQ